MLPMLSRVAALLRQGRSEYFGGDGPRGYVGGLWHEMGELQFKFLVSHGLRPEHVCLDIACGSLRAGVRLIPYLDTGHYLGLDIADELIRHGRDVELGPALNYLKKPELIVSDAFQFDRFSRRPDYAIAQSLFTHLTPEDVGLCLQQLRRVATPTLQFFASFHEAPVATSNPSTSDPHTRFAYTAGEMEQMGEAAGWRIEYLGEWNHPRGQKMLRFRPIPSWNPALAPA